MGKSLTKILKTTLAGSLITISSGCYYSYPGDYGYQNSQQTQVRRQETIENKTRSQPRWVIEDPCTNPKIILREADPRFRRLSKRNFIISGYDSVNDNVNYNDIRWIFYAGEEFAVTAYFPENLRNSRLNLVVMSPSDRVIGRRNYDPATEARILKFAVSNCIKIGGEGVYKFAWGFDGKLACIQYVKLLKKRP